MTCLTSGFKKIREKMQEEKISLLCENAYLLVLAFYLIRWCFNNTMFSIPWPRYIDWELRLLGFGIGCVRVLTVKNIKKSEVYLIGVSFLFCFLTFVHTRYGFLLEIPIFMMGAWNIHYKRILKTFIVCNASVLAVTVYGAFCGIIPDLVQFRMGESAELLQVRHSFGTVYCTDFAAWLFYLALALWMYKDDICDGFFSLLFVCISLISYFYAGARNTSVLSIAVAIIMIVMGFSKKRGNKKKRKYNYLGYITVILSLITGCFVAFLGIMLTEESHVWQVLNKVLSSRLRFVRLAYEEYGISLWGTYFGQMGAGGLEGQSVIPYNFIDISYCLIVIRYGMGILLVWALLFGFVGNRAIKSGKERIVAVLAIITLHGVIEHHVMELVYSSILLLPLVSFEKEVKISRKLPVEKKGKLCFLFFADLIILVEGFYLWRSYANCKIDDQSVIFLIVSFTIGMISIVWGKGKCKKRLMDICFAGILSLIIICGYIQINNKRIILNVDDCEYVVLNEMIDVQKKRGGSVYSDVPIILSNKEEGYIKQIIWYGNACAGKKNLIYVTNADRDLYLLSNLKYKYIKISNRYGVYTNSDDIVELLENRGYTSDVVCSYQYPMELTRKEDNWIGEYDIHAGYEWVSVRTALLFKGDVDSFEEDKIVFSVKVVGEQEDRVYYERSVSAREYQETMRYGMGFDFGIWQEEKQSLVVTDYSNGKICLDNVNYWKVVD